MKRTYRILARMGELTSVVYDSVGDDHSAVWIMLAPIVPRRELEVGQCCNATVGLQDDWTYEVERLS